MTPVARAFDHTLSGRVTAFDRDRGLGELVAADGDVYPFHCIEIGDGTRDIAVGTEVRFVRHAKLGRYEAAAITGA